MLQVESPRSRSLVPGVSALSVALMVFRHYEDQSGRLLQEINNRFAHGEDRDQADWMSAPTSAFPGSISCSWGPHEILLLHSFGKSS
jgi:hypothetical protein